MDYYRARAGAARHVRRAGRAAERIAVPAAARHQPALGWRIIRSAASSTAQAGACQLAAGSCASTPPSPGWMAVPSAALVEWLRASGGAAHPALDFFAAAAAADGDRRVVARQPIDCGDLLLRLPPCCVLPLLGLGDHRKSSCVKILGALRPPPSAMVQAALELLCVRNQATAGCDGHWQPYINSLPRTCVTPAMYWSDTQRELLAGTMYATQNISIIT
eukprot:SAG31_NODE_65_length_28565_cov_8.402914_17_plen_219_part_00